jgi:hypothetical protein
MDYLKLPSMDRSTRLRAKQHGFQECTSEGESVVLRFSSKALRFPRAAERSLRSIGDLQEFEVRSLDGDLDDAEKIKLCSTLVREGFLTIVD